MTWVLLRWSPTDGDARMPRFRNMYDIMTEEQWLRRVHKRLTQRDMWEVVATTDTPDEAKALLNLMPKYNDDTQTS